MNGTKLKTAVVQMSSSDSGKENLNRSIGLMDSVISQRPDIFIFPEYQMLSKSYEDSDFIFQNAEPIDGRFVKELSSYAKKNRVNILCNIAELEYGISKPYNTSVLISREGYIAGKYRKLHLFDALGKSESSAYSMGYQSPVPFNLSKMTVGVQICYDLRFPEAARLLAVQESKILVYQAGWFKGERKLDQWRTLIRTRAIENGVFVLASAQCGEKYTGHSMIVSPYGDVLAEAEEEETVLVSEIDTAVADRYLEEVPVIRARRLDIYDVNGR